MSFWSIRSPWSAIQVTDEFGAGTLDGTPADGPSFDACGAAAQENGAAAYEGRAPTYSNIGHIRADMIANGQWTAGASVGNPRTNGCYIQNVAWELPRRGYDCLELKIDDGAVPSAADVRGVLARHGRYTIFLVTDAQALSGNEQGVFGHYVGIAAYDAAADKVYVLNSDIAGQHGLAPGQWMTVAAFMAAQPMGWAVMAPQQSVTPPPPPPPAPQENIVIILEKDAAGNVTGAHDANQPGIHIGAGLAAAAQAANLLGEDLTLGEQPGSANGQPAALCTLGHRYLGGYGKASGVSRFVDFFEAAQQVEAVFATRASLQQQLAAAQTAGQQASAQAQAAQAAEAAAKAAEAQAQQQLAQAQAADAADQAQVAKLTDQVNAAAQQLAEADAQIAQLQQQLAQAQQTPPSQGNPQDTAIAQAAESLVAAVEAALSAAANKAGKAGS